MRKSPAEFRRISAMLADEVLTWPGVTVQPMFGMRALYRDGTVFALLPETRTIGPVWAPSGTSYPTDLKSARGRNGSSSK
jgi:hypothetical protein